MSNILDIAHLAFLEMIRDAIKTTGPTAAKGALLRRAIGIAQEVPEVRYKDLDEWTAAVGSHENPITKVEGVSVRHGHLFALPACPFAPSIRTYVQLFGALPEDYGDVVNEFNKSSDATGRLKVGHGAGVSPFCAVHQPLRASIGKKIFVGGKNVGIYQLGCKTGAGKKGFASEFIREFGVEEAVVDGLLNDAMCVYGVKVIEQ